MPQPLNLALLISGGGSTAEAIIQACQEGAELYGLINPACIIASKPGIPGIERAIEAGIPEEKVHTFVRKNFDSADLFGEAILKVCAENKVDLIGQYGWLVKTPVNVINAYENKIINQHPGPLGYKEGSIGGKGMYGLRVHQARLDYVRSTKEDYWTEATAHLVTEEYDEGAVIGRSRVAILEDDTAESLAARVLPEEHKLQIQVLKDFVSSI